MRISGVILDIYDDPKGQVLVSLLDGHPLPEKLASSRLLEPDELAALPDRLFGLVADDGARQIRKYAMCDEPHLMTSILYFMDQGGVLPHDTQQKVAANLVNACAWYDMDPPESLVKRAMLGKALGGLGSAAMLGLGAMEVGNQVKETGAKNRQASAQFRRAQVLGSKVAGREIELSPEETKGIGDSAELPTTGGPGRALSAAQEFSLPDATYAKLTKQLEKSDQLDPDGKVADLNGTEMMPHGALSVPVRNNPSKKVSLPAKTAAGKIASQLIDVGHAHSGDLAGAEVPAVIKRAEHKHFALPHQSRYPIDTAAHVKTAQAYFDEHASEFELGDRRIYAQSLVTRAEELGVKIAGEALKYAGTEYGPYIDSELVARVRSFEGTGHETVYAMLREKRANVPPPVMVEMLKQADLATGADRVYGRPSVGYRDPYQAVYGKVAEAVPDKQDVFSWSEGNDYVSGMQLNALASSGADLDGIFGKDFSQQFRKDPVGMFQSLPDPQKVILSRMSADNSGTTSRI